MDLLKIIVGIIVIIAGIAIVLGYSRQIDLAKREVLDSKEIVENMLSDIESLLGFPGADPTRHDEFRKFFGIYRKQFSHLEDNSMDVAWFKEQHAITLFELDLRSFLRSLRAELNVVKI